MLSTRNSANLVSYSDGMFTRYSAAPTNLTHGHPQNDLIAFLSVVQKYNVGYLPITWQPALNDLGQGGSATISQSTFNTDMPLAFKRFHDDDGSDTDFLPLISEVLILSQPAIQNHPNIINLEGICWEIKHRTEKAVPVLVFEKAGWDLQQFMNVREGRNMSMDDRLNLCADIGSAISTLHAYNIIHGDIKPQNVLIFKDATGKTTVKVADFGYSTLAAEEAENICLPKSRPWNAPEHHFREFTTHDAKQTDVYSFGMLCLWVVSGGIPILQNNTEYTFDAPTGPSTALEQLKYDDKLEQIANQFIDSIPLASAEHRNRLREFFSLAVPLNTAKRTSDLKRLVGLLRREQIEFEAERPINEASIRELIAFLKECGMEAFSAKSQDRNKDLSRHAGFMISENLDDLVGADYRVRKQIRESLEKNYHKNQNQSFATHIAFQLAFCYRIGFGVKSDDNKCHMWLEKSNKQLNDLQVEKEAVRPAKWKNGRMRGLTGLVQVNLIHEYRTYGLAKLEEARKEYKREVKDMIQEFGELHFIPLSLNTTIAHTYWIQGQWKETEELLVQVMEIEKRVLGQEHPSTLTSMANLALTYRDQGRWKEAEELFVQVMQTEKRVLGQGYPSTLTRMGSLASTYRNQGRWKEAEELEEQVMETRKRVLGQEHPDTLTSMDNLASTFLNQGRWKEAEKLLVQAMEMRKRVLGQEHPDTLTSMANLALTYRNQGRWKEAEVLFVQVMQKEKRVLGQEHPDTLISMANLASTFLKQGRRKKAEELLVQVMEIEKRVLSQEHPDTLTSMANLASIYRSQGRWKEAEELEVQVMETRKRVLGQEHPDTLTSMASLASTYRNQGRWKEAEELEVKVMETSKRVLGQEHPDTLTSMAILASTYTNQGRWNEAEALLVQVMETRKRVFGQEHPSIMTSIGNLASIYRNQGRWKEAEELDEQAMETFKRVLGQEHPDTLTSMNNLASTFSNQGRWKEAEELLGQVMETRKKVLGQEHPDTLTSMGNLASTYRNQGRWKEAEELEVQVMETFQRVLGQEHPDTLTSMNNLASTYSNQERWTEAETLLIQVTNKRRMTYGEDHPDTVHANANLATLRKNRKASQRLSDQYSSEYGLHEALEGHSFQFWDMLLQSALAMPLENDNTGEERLCSSPRILQKSGDDDDFGTDEEKLHLALAMSLEMYEDGDTDEERLQRALDMSLEADEDNDSGTDGQNEADEDNETEEEQLQRALTMSMEADD